MLQELDCYNNKLAGKLDLRHCHEIAMLDCSYNEDLTELWLYEHCLTSDLIKDEQTAVIRHDDNNIPVKIGIPDRYFKDFLLSICDANNNGVISSEEAATITEIDLNDIAVPCYITSMEGIEHFANLEKFWDSGDYHIDANSECTVGFQPEHGPEISGSAEFPGSEKALPDRRTHIRNARTAREFIRNGIGGDLQIGSAGNFTWCGRSGRRLRPSVVFAPVFLPALRTPRPGTDPQSPKYNTKKRGGWHSIRPVRVSVRNDPLPF